MSSDWFHSLTSDDLVLDALPDDIAESVHARDKWLASLRKGGRDGLEFILDDISRWPVGQPVRVAFRGGTAELHAAIVAATQEIRDSCSLVLDFGPQAAQGVFRTWSPSDTV